MISKYTMFYKEGVEDMIDVFGDIMNEIIDDINTEDTEI